MARFAAVLLAAAAALLAAGRLTHAAPSTAEVFWRAVLPGSAVPDAVLRLLRPNNNLVGEAKSDDVGPPSYAFSSRDYRRSSAPLDHDSKAASKGGTKDESPFNYLYMAPGEHHRAAATKDESPFNYLYMAPGEHHRAAATKDESPFNYLYMAPGEHHRAAATTTTTTTVFFHEEAVRVGERLPFHFPPAKPSALGLLPRHVADVIPFAAPALPAVLALLGVSPGSAQAAAMAETLRACEAPPLGGETTFCATSLEALAERAMAALGTRDVRAVTSTLPRAGAPLQMYTVRAVRPVDGASFVACHDEPYPYTVYWCHGTGPARAYMVEMEGARGGAVTVATVCHTETSLWNPEHVSFKLLGTKPGGAPICHLMPYGHMIWA